VTSILADAVFVAAAGGGAAAVLDVAVQVEFEKQNLNPGYHI
jgi:hypothetical protein